MPRLAVLGDVHGHFGYLEESIAAIASERPDGLLLVGDLGFEQDLGGSAGRVLEAASALGVDVLFVPGNHDLPELPDAGRARNADRRRLEICGLTVWGFGGSPRAFGFPHEWPEAAVPRALDRSVDLLLLHCPPHGCGLDLTTRGQHVGSQALRALLAAARPRLALCGHIHEAPGCEVVEGVPCVNAGSLGPPFGAPQIVILDWQPSGIEVRHAVLSYAPQPCSAPWCSGEVASPPPGVRRWRLP